MPRLGHWMPWRILALVLVVGLSLAILLIPQDQIEALQGYGYPGIFLLSLAANATIIVPAPAILVVFALGAHLSPLWLGLAAGSGAALGELSGYLAGFSGQAIIEDKPIYQRLAAWMQRFGSITIFVLALVPNPIFDLAGIAAGAARMPVWRFLVSCWLGKVLRMIGIAMVGAGLFSKILRIT
ncbi:MAG: VTT domain-containing protein [Anaerolineales bacterium]